MIKYLRELYISAQLQGKKVLPTESGPDFDRWLDQHERELRGQIADEIRSHNFTYPVHPASIRAGDSTSIRAVYKVIEDAAQLVEGVSSE